MLEALRANAPLQRIVIARGAGGARLQEIIELARHRHVPVSFEARAVLDRMAPGSTHQGVIALAAAAPYREVESVAADARLLVVLDGIEDPHNLGAIIRTAHAAGADAVILPQRRAAGLTEAAIKAAAGAVEHIPVARTTNINRLLEDLKEKGYWIYGLDERGEHLYDQVPFSLPSVIVLGSEGKGLHHLVKQHCDFLVRLPMHGKIASLNVSVAAGIMLYEWRRRAQPR